MEVAQPTRIDDLYVALASLVFHIDSVLGMESIDSMMIPLEAWFYFSNSIIA